MSIFRRKPDWPEATQDQTVTVRNAKITFSSKTSGDLDDEEDALARFRIRLDSMSIPHDKDKMILRIMDDVRRNPEEYDDVIHDTSCSITTPAVLVGGVPRGTLGVSPSFLLGTGVKKNATADVRFEGRSVRLRVVFLDGVPEYQISISRGDSDALGYRPGGKVHLHFDSEDIEDGLLQLKFTGDESPREILDMVKLGCSESVDRRRARTSQASITMEDGPHLVRIPANERNPVTHRENMSAFEAGQEHVLSRRRVFLIIEIVCIVLLMLAIIATFW